MSVPVLTRDLTLNNATSQAGHILLHIESIKTQSNTWFFYMECHAMPNHCFSLIEWSGQTDLGTRGGAALLQLRVHALSLTHCLAPSLTLSLSVSFPSSHILLSSSTYFLGGGGGGCRYTTRSSVWETQSKTGTDSPRCTDHSGGLHPFLMSTAPLPHSAPQVFVLCLCWGPLHPRNPLSRQLFPFLNRTHTPTRTH